MSYDYVLVEWLAAMLRLDCRRQGWKQRDQLGGYWNNRWILTDDVAWMVLGAVKLV